MLRRRHDSWYSPPPPPREPTTPDPGVYERQPRPPYPRPGPSTDEALHAVARLHALDPVAEARILRDIATIQPDLVHAATTRLLASHLHHPSATEDVRGG